MTVKRRRADSFIQRDVLHRALASIRDARDIVVFDLDSTLLNNHPRQARIVREFGRSIGDARLEQCQPSHWADWNLETPLRRLGLSEEEVEAIVPAARKFWQRRFFTSEYCVDDVAMPGAVSFLAEVDARGATICYVTGRHTEMGTGTVETFRREGFPLPDEDRVHLLLKPNFSFNDDGWKVEARTRLREIGRVVSAFDNEPSHINSYHLGIDGCFAVHLDTDHSERPIEVHDSIPSIRDFVLS